MDYSRLRAAAFRDGEDEEAVTVDTRALIDKVLARYSGEWTTLRELIQNAADAQATTVKIKWETLPSTSVPLPQTTSRSELLKHTLTNHTLRRLVVQNNGQPFTKTDWGRLKRIAEGNPDETKIGAFGVGFYSVFADCEEPMISSGSEAMAFYWKGNALFTRKLQLPESESSPDTAFVLDYRNTTTPLPNFLSVAQFLATSLTFVALQNIEFWIDDYQILALQKKTSPSVQMSIPRNFETRTKDGLMRLASVERTSAQIDATFMNVIGWKPQSAAASNKSNEAYYSGAPEIGSLRSFFSRLTTHAGQSGIRGKAAKEEQATQVVIAEDLTAITTSSIFLRVTAGQIATSVSASFASELERATKKPPPKMTKLAILTSSYDETVASENSTSASQVTKAADVFSSVLPSKKPGGRIFIGFPTTQTTGAGMHISAPSVIPTVEREAIDLNARWVRNWNIEMLRVAGVMTRLAFANEMSDLHEKLKSMAEKNQKKSVVMADVLKCLPEALHILKTFTFGDSTPSGQVAQIIEEAFWVSYKKAAIEVYSSQGVLSTEKVRVASDELGKFVNGLPVILEDMKDAPFVKRLLDFGLIRDITVDDVVHELGAKALDKDQLHHFIAWAGKSAISGELDPPSKQRLLDVAVATVSEGENSGEIIALGTIKNYLVPGKIPATLPIPPTTLPIAFTVNIPVAQLQALGWTSLEIVPWLRYLIELAGRNYEEQSLTTSSNFAIQVLGVLSKNWDNLSASSKGTVISALQPITCIPTKMGMRKPNESYFSSVKLFDDLPTVQGCQNVKEKFFAALGVRKTIDLDTIFTRLLNTSPQDQENGKKKWSHMELIKYLASVSNDIPAEDMRKLKESRLCPAEAGPAGLEPTKGTTQLYKVSELFEPKDTLRALKLPILQWPGPPGSYRQSSPEGRFLSSLGLRPFPTVPELVDMMASPDVELRTKAMSYFTANHQINMYYNFNLGGSNKAILPLQGNEKQLVSPSACYTNEGAAVLGFNILRKDLHIHANKFGVAMDPPMTSCVDRLLANPPKNQDDAMRVFGYLSTRVSDLGTNHKAKLRDAHIVPVVRTKARASVLGKPEKEVILIQPQSCYLGSSTTYGDIFDFVDFGQIGNYFLLQCGAKQEPTKTEIARLACSEPARLLSVLQSSEKYLNLLKSLADDLPTLGKDRDLIKKMRTAPFLLGFREISKPTNGKENKDSEFEEDEAPIRHYQLASASQIVILDDYISYRLFKGSLLCAPEDDALEAFYMALGSENLSSKVQEDVRIGPLSRKQDGAVWLRKHVLERSKLFLYEYSKFKRDAIKQGRDEKWLGQNLRVEAVSTVALRRSLRGHGQSHTEKRSAASNPTDNGYVLYVASEQGRPDMYQVGQAICQLLLTRPSQQAFFFFEPFLKLDLLELRARGYNVDRILRVKAAEARVAEEERRKALEAEEQKIKEAEAAWKSQLAAEAESNAAAASATRQSAPLPDVKTPKKDRMPGSFEDSPEDHSAPLPPLPPKSKGARSLFQNWTRRLGLEQADDDDNDEAANKVPPQSTRHPMLGGGPTETQGTMPRPPNDDGRVTSPAVVQQNLLNAVNSTRAHDSNGIFSPPNQTEVKEQATYCDNTPAQSIEFVAEAPQGMRVFLARESMVTHGGSTDPAQFLAEKIGEISQFEAVLKDVASIYGLAPRALHIFHDEKGGTIAFNNQGAIFCNLRFYLQLHDAKMATGSGEARVEAASWWWVVLAHELAHNLVGPHNAEHSYYTESMLQYFYPKMMAKSIAWTGNSGAAGPSRSSTPASTGLPSREQPPPPYQRSAGPTGTQSLLD